MKMTYVKESKLNQCYEISTNKCKRFCNAICICTKTREDGAFAAKKR